jgi:hypothetical protein
MRIRKFFFKSFLAVLALVALVLIARTGVNVVEGKRFAAALADLKAKGTPLAAKDVVPPCPEGDNGARLWKAAEELAVFSTDDTQTLSGVLASLGRGAEIPADVRTAAAALAAKNRRALDLIPEIAGKPCFQYAGPGEIAWPRAKVPNASVMLRMMRLWGFAAVTLAEQGDLPRALEMIRTALRFAPQVTGEALLISYLVGLADERSALLFLNRALSGRDVSEDLLRPLLDDLGDGMIDQWRVRMKNSIRGERVLYVELGTKPLSTILESMSVDMGLAKRLFYWLALPLSKRDIRENVGIYDELEAGTALPYYKTRDLWKAAAERGSSLPWYAAFSKAMLPNLETTFMKTALMESLALTARAGIACRIYKLRNKTYPDTLDALVPGLLSAVPTDPFTGKSLVYRREGEGFVVYSLGTNQKDDDGRMTWEVTQLVADKDDDWTWREKK